MRRLLQSERPPVCIRPLLSSPASPGHEPPVLPYASPPLQLKDPNGSPPLLLAQPDVAQQALIELQAELQQLRTEVARAAHEAQVQAKEWVAGAVRAVDARNTDLRTEFMAAVRGAKLEASRATQQAS